MESAKPVGRSLLLFPCSKSKNGHRPLQSLAPRSVLEFLSPTAAAALTEARMRAFEPGRYSKVTINLASPKIPALGLYTGTTYEVPGFRQAVMAAVESGSHCLVISGGYGLVRPEEPIHSYGAHISKTSSLWSPLLASLIQDYARNCDIQTIFIACSTPYASVLRGFRWSDPVQEVYWCVPTVRAGEGSPMREVPKRIGEAVVRLVHSRFTPDQMWKRDGAPHQTPTTSSLRTPMAMRVAERPLPDRSYPPPPPREPEPSRGTSSRLCADDFRAALRSLVQTSQQRGETALVLKSGDLHRQVGGYPGPSHRMPVCCEVMYSEMRAGDEVLASPPKGKGASLTIRYRLPRSVAGGR